MNIFDGVTDKLRKARAARAVINADQGTKNALLETKAKRESFRVLNLNRVVFILLNAHIEGRELTNDEIDEIGERLEKVDKEFVETEHTKITPPGDVAMKGTDWGRSPIEQAAQLIDKEKAMREHIHGNSLVKPTQPPPEPPKGYSVKPEKDGVIVRRSCIVESNAAYSTRIRVSQEGQDYIERCLDCRHSARFEVEGRTIRIDGACAGCEKAAEIWVLNGDDISSRYATEMH